MRLAVVHSLARHLDDNVHLFNTVSRPERWAPGRKRGQPRQLTPRLNSVSGGTRQYPTGAAHGGFTNTSDGMGLEEAGQPRGTGGDCHSCQPQGRYDWKLAYP